MLETSDYPTIARTIRIQPPPDAKPVDGYSWGDYEDVQVSGGDAGGNDADGEDDGWGVVKSKKQPRKERPASAQPQSHTQKAPETLTKRQRQNASRREAEKEAKAALEAEQQAALANHRRELEKLRMAEQQQKEKKGTKVSGGMKASVDDNGRLVWE
ncbi:hypothetical protein BDQ17DRAFT_1435580 [Cyathus striatus]|nr:hypothetical protein BDQ17DRAFT_1435580 [Cyathus striatus]